MNNQEKEQLCTFWEFLKNYEIEIPIVQRDYAQGRIENKIIRETFLDTIYNALKDNKAINLDFIYGNIVNDNIFQPLDGQQRLTTLFLLHIYAYKKTANNSEEINNILKKFRYETRATARFFCEELAQQQIIIDKNTERISDYIKDSAWYYLSWKNDPTIRAMLVMLDAIHNKFKDFDNLFSILTDTKLITFYNLILEDFGLSDDLYIKMNARGKLLTPFENLKAEIQKKAKDQGWENNKKEIDKFAYKIDGEWTDLMWETYRRGDSVDEAHMHLISAIVMLQIALTSKQDNETREDVIKKINDTYDDRCLINYINEQVFNYIYETYCIYEQIQNSNYNLDLKFKLWRHKPKIAFFDEVVYDCLDNNSSYTCKILFYAQTEYFRRNKNFEYEHFQDWMRVIRNIVVRGNIDLNTKNCKRADLIRSPKAFIGMTNLVNELANGSDNIYKYLSKNEIKSSYAKDQTKEERLKATIIEKFPEYKTLIIDLEDIEILKGRILFALRCANYNDIDIMSIDWDLLKKVKIVLEKYFNSETQTLTNDLRRALLTIDVDGENSFYNYWKSTCAILEDAPFKRRLIESFNELEYLANTEHYNKYLMNLVKLLINKNYSEIIEDFDSCPQERLEKIPDWQIKLILEPEILDQCSSYYISISDGKDSHATCYLLPNSRPRDITKCKKL